MSLAPSPLHVSIEADTGVGGSFADHYVKKFADVTDIYYDQAAAAAVDPDSVAYEVFSNERTNVGGALIFGTSVLMPRLIGDEFSMTRGHQHEITDRAEVYYCLSGVGVLLMEDAEGRTVAQEMTPGDAVYVPGGWIHRSVNVGTEQLVTLFCFAADAGQDYSVIDRSRGMAMQVVTDGSGGWRLVDNPRYVGRS